MKFHASMNWLFVMILLLTSKFAHYKYRCFFICLSWLPEKCFVIYDFIFQKCGVMFNVRMASFLKSFMEII